MKVSHGCVDDAPLQVRKVLRILSLPFLPLYRHRRVLYSYFFVDYVVLSHNNPHFTDIVVHLYFSPLFIGHAEFAQ